MSISLVAIADVVEELAEIVEDMYLSNVTTEEENNAFQELIERIAARHNLEGS
jgi:hypothetical protein